MNQFWEKLCKIKKKIWCLRLRFKKYKSNKKLTVLILEDQVKEDIVELEVVFNRRSKKSEIEYWVSSNTKLKDLQKIISILNQCTVNHLRRNFKIHLFKNKTEELLNKRLKTNLKVMNTNYLVTMKIKLLNQDYHILTLQIMVLRLILLIIGKKNWVKKILLVKIWKSSHQPSTLHLFDWTREPVVNLTKKLILEMICFNN